jgi:peptide/nickel transport system permease protein
VSVSGETTAQPGGRLPWMVRVVRRRTTSARVRRRRRYGLYIGATFVGVILAASLLQPLLGLPAPNAQSLGAALTGPSAAHPFGTDNVGRDVLSRTLAATRLDLAVVTAVTAASCLIGLLLGALAGFLGGAVESVIMRTVDVLIAVPFMVLVVALIAIVGPGLKAVLICVPAVGWVTYARLTRAEMLVLREQEFLMATKTMGFSRRRSLFVHALPNAWRPALVFSTVDAVSNIVLLASLSFLGLGVQEPTAEWGRIIATGQADLFTAWWISVLPGLVVILVGVGLALIGDGLADVFGEEIELVA